MKTINPAAALILAARSAVMAMTGITSAHSGADTHGTADNDPGVSSGTVT
ncbi:hypothetical protein GCM10010211_71310 [Streptomyces albospinus]|uniref:Uncharacterized protein n=1 Tax=Streptomyces albospinus TaxID=285515 RepID=A0ABQ2VP47_9ACTN|nr:hypothetical protein [Streptomyces albospinus]GGU94001.1 hypothetical protein GCM10010211_71310 [Streptomyces albospinus]